MESSSSPSPLALSPEVDLYADGSCCPEIGIGGWAYRIPLYEREQAGIDNGTIAQTFELLAVVQGLDAVAQKDPLAKIRVFSDCQHTVATVTRVVSAPTYESLKAEKDKDLLRRLYSVTRGRRVRAVQYKGGSLDHSRCHRNAYRSVHDAIKASPFLAAGFALVRIQSRLQQLVLQREGLDRGLLRLDEKIMEQEALVKSLRVAQGASHPFFETEPMNGAGVDHANL